MGSKSAKIIGVDGKDAGDVELPEVFNSPVRLDVISRAVIAQQSRRFQPQGRNRMAGKRTTAESFGVGRALSRVPRISEPPLSGQGSWYGWGTTGISTDTVEETDQTDQQEGETFGVEIGNCFHC